MTTAIELIKSFEGCKLSAYPDADGFSIGFGHFGANEGQTITQEEADRLLSVDVANFTLCVDKICPQSTPGQLAAMTSLCFNIGCAAFGRSSVARLHNQGRYAEAAQAFALWNKSQGKVIPTLVARRAREAAVYLEDEPATQVPRAEGEKPMTHSRTQAGHIIAGAGTVATGAVDYLANHSSDISQVHDALTPLQGYWGWIVVVTTILSLLGIVVAWYARHNDRDTGRN